MSLWDTKFSLVKLMKRLRALEAAPDEGSIDFAGLLQQ